jgi:hypothetical protein
MNMFRIITQNQAPNVSLFSTFLFEMMKQLKNLFLVMGIW